MVGVKVGVGVLFFEVFKNVLGDMVGGLKWELVYGRVSIEIGWCIFGNWMEVGDNGFWWFLVLVEMVVIEMKEYLGNWKWL